MLWPTPRRTLTATRSPYPTVVRSGSTARAHPDAGVAGVLDEVPGYEEVRREPHRLDDLQPVGDALHDRVGHLRAPPLLGALEGEVPQVVAVVLEALRQREVGQLRLAELDGDVGTLGDPEGVVARLGQLVEEVAHLLRRLQVVLVTGELEAVGVALQRSGLHAEQRVVGGGRSEERRVGKAGVSRWDI